MEKNEFDMIYSAIKLRMNKEIKEIKKYIKLQEMEMILMFFIKNVIILQIL